MDVEKLIEQLRTESLYADKASLEIMDLCMEAATALSTLQAENEKLRAELEQARESLDFTRTKDAEIVRLGAELERVKAERDAAVERIREWEKFDTYLFVHNFITPEKWRGPGKENCP